MPARKTASKSLPAKKIAPITDVQSGSPTTTKPAQNRGTKRKAKVLASDSDVSNSYFSEIVPAPSPSSPKKKKSSKLPEPGSPAYANLPAVSVNAKVDRALLSSSPHITFGSVGEGHDFAMSDTDVPVASPSRSRSRVKTPSEKARLMEDQKSGGSTRSRRLTEKTLIADHDDGLQSLVNIASPLSLQYPPSPSPKLETGGPSRPTSSADINSDDDSDGTIQSATVTPKRVKSSLVSPGNKSDHVAGGRSNAKTATVASDDESTSDVGASSDENDELSVMRRDLQDPSLYGIYENLPRLRRFCDVKTFSQYGSDESPRILFSALRQILGESSINAVLEGLKFVQCGCFVNTSRIDPRLLTADSNYLKIASTKRIAVSLMMGMVTECALVEHAWGGPPNSPYPVRKISIVPFAQEMRRDTSAWGQLFLFHVISGAVSNMGFSFFSRRQGGTGGSQSSPKKSGLFTVVSSPLVRGDSSQGASYPPSRAFDDKIPIYDGRPKGGPGFLFTDEDFRSLSSLPLYRDGKRDLSDRAVVAVGYSLSTYKSSQTDMPVLSSNVQFVILLGMTTASAV